MPKRDDLPRVGGTIEDETGWWEIIAVDPDENEVCLRGRDGEERWVEPGNLGAVRYDNAPDGDLAYELDDVEDEMDQESEERYI